MPFEIFIFNDDFLSNLYINLYKMIILEENFKWHLEAFASELFIYSLLKQEVKFNQVSTFLVQNNLLDNNQSGFKSGHSTETLSH